MNQIIGQSSDLRSSQDRIQHRRNELVSRGKNALLIMLEKGMFSSVASIRLTNELGSESPFLVSVTGETSGLHGESVFNERFRSADSMKEFVGELAEVLFPDNHLGRNTIQERAVSWPASIGSSVRIFPV